MSLHASFLAAFSQVIHNGKATRLEFFGSTGSVQTSSTVQELPCKFCASSSDAHLLDGVLCLTLGLEGTVFALLASRTHCSFCSVCCAHRYLIYCVSSTREARQPWTSTPPQEGREHEHKHKLSTALFIGRHFRLLESCTSKDHISLAHLS